MDKTYNRTENRTYTATRNHDQTYVTTPKKGNQNETYVTSQRKTNYPNLTYDKTPQGNRTFNKSSGREANRTNDSEDSSSVDFVQEEDYTPESPTPPFESSESSNEGVDSFSKFGAPNQQSTPKKNLDFLREFDVLGPIMKQLDHSIRNNLGQTFTKSPGEKYSTPSKNRTWTIFLDDMANDHTKRSKSTPRRATTSPQYYVSTPTRSSPRNDPNRQNKIIARKLDFSNNDNQLYFSNRMSVTRTEPNGTSITFTRSKSGPDVSVLKNRDC